MTAILVALLVGQTPTSWFDKSLASHKALQSFSVQIQVNGKSGSSKEASTVNVTAKGGDVLYRFRTPAKPGLDRSDLVFMLRGTKLTGYDQVANERLERTVSKSGTRVSRLEEGMGTLEESAADLLDATKLKGLYTGLKAMGGWKESRGPGVRKLVRSDKAKGSARIAFDASTNLLRELWLKNNGSELHWQMAYSQPKAIALPIPSNAKKVTSFTQNEAPPSFASKAAQSTYNSLLNSASRLKRATISIAEDGAVSKITYNPGAVKETQPRITWAFNGKTLTVKALSGTYYRGSCKQSDLIEMVGQLGGRVGPYTRNLILRRVPFKSYFNGRDKITLAGSLTVKGVKCTILRSLNPGRRISILIRSDNHLPESVTIDTLDGKGHVLTTSIQEFTFSRVNQTQPLTDLTLSIPSGKVAKPLPKLKSPLG